MSDFITENTTIEDLISYCSSCLRYAQQRYCVLIVQTDRNELVIVDGIKSESGIYGSAICPERSALFKFESMITSSKASRIRKCVIGSDSNVPIAPCSLCRELLTIFCDDETEIILSSSSQQIVKHNLQSLYPYPSIFRTCAPQELSSMAMTVASKIKRDLYYKISPNLTLEGLIDIASAAASAFSNENNKLVFGATVAFSDGEIMTATELRGGSYDNIRLDPVSQLVSNMERSYINISPADPSLLQYCIDGNIPKIVSALESKPFCINSADADGWNPLINASKSGHHMYLQY